MRVRFCVWAYTSSVLLVAALSSPALAGPPDPSNPMESSYAAPIKGDIIEWRAPARTLERAVMFPEGSATLSKRVEGALTQLAKEIGGKVQVVVIGRDDDSQTEGLAEARAQAISMVLAKAGVPAENLTKQLGPQSVEKSGKEGAWFVASHIRWTPEGALMQPPVPPAPPVLPINPAASNDRKLIQMLVAKGAISQEQGEVALRDGFRAVQVNGVPLKSSFDVLASDGDVSATLRRWGAANGYKVSWEAGAPAPITGDLTLNAKTFLEAVSQVVGGLQSAGYPIKAQTLANNQVRITAVEKQQ